jgi:hypothetical protein
VRRLGGLGPGSGLMNSVYCRLPLGAREEEIVIVLRLRRIDGLGSH